MDLTKLQTFCGTTGKMIYPWSKDEFTYATNGFVLVRVPRMEEVTDEGGPSVASFYQDHPMPSDGWEKMPSREHLGDPRECPDCHGSEHPNCAECEGTGTVEWFSGFHTYECDCKSCDGNGSGTCSNCNGVGVIDPISSVSIAGASFSTAYLRLFFDLSNCEIAPPFNGSKLSWVRFDGGDAFIMPRTQGNH